MNTPGLVHGLSFSLKVDDTKMYKLIRLLVVMINASLPNIWHLTHPG